MSDLIAGVPASYYNGPPETELPEPETDEEWAQRHGLALPAEPEEPEPELPGRVVPLTDHRGVLLVPASETYEPLPGSIVLTGGLHGTAWQRFFSDGRWHPTRGGGSKSWADLLGRRNLVLVYDAEERGPVR